MKNIKLIFISQSEIDIGTLKKAESEKMSKHPMENISTTSISKIRNKQEVH